MWSLKCDTLCTRNIKFKYWFRQFVLFFSQMQCAFNSWYMRARYAIYSVSLTYDLWSAFASALICVISCHNVICCLIATQIARSMGPTWGPPGSCRPQMGPMLAPWTLLSGNCWGYYSSLVPATHLKSRPLQMITMFFIFQWAVVMWL